MLCIKTHPLCHLTRQYLQILFTVTLIVCIPNISTHIYPMLRPAQLNLILFLSCCKLTIAPHSPHICHPSLSPSSLPIITILHHHRYMLLQITTPPIVPPYHPHQIPKILFRNLQLLHQSRFRKVNVSVGKGGNLEALV